MCICFKDVKYKYNYRAFGIFVSRVFSDSNYASYHVILNNTDQKTLPLFLVVVMRAVSVVEDRVVDKEVVGFIVVGCSVVG